MSWPAFWKQKNWQSVALLPLSKLVCWEAARRYRKFKAFNQSKPTSRQTKSTVLVVGNLVVGGTGKTPFIVWLAKQLQAQEFNVAIVSRGYGAKNNQWPLLVDAKNRDLIQASRCGDEPLLLARQTKCPVAVSPKRVEAIELLNQTDNFDFIISDDGLQHFAMQRDIEVVMVDAQRQFGNQLCMPSGPLREPLARIQDVDFTIWNGLANEQLIPTVKQDGIDLILPSPFTMQLQPVLFRQVGDPEQTLSLQDFLARYPHKKAIAMAGIGNPQRFFNSLQAMQLDVTGYAFADHSAYSEAILKQQLGKDFNEINQSSSDENPIKPLLMTEKDAVKCESFAKSQAHWWYLEVEPHCSEKLLAQIIAKHQQRLSTK